MQIVIVKVIVIVIVTVIVIVIETDTNASSPDDIGSQSAGLCVNTSLCYVYIILLI